MPLLVEAWLSRAISTAALLGMRPTPTSKTRRSCTQCPACRCKAQSGAAVAMHGPDQQVAAENFIRDQSHRGDRPAEQRPRREDQGLRRTLRDDAVFATKARIARHSQTRRSCQTRSRRPDDLSERCSAAAHVPAEPLVKDGNRTRLRVGTHCNKDHRTTLADQRIQS